MWCHYLNRRKPYNPIENAIFFTETHEWFCFPALCESLTLRADCYEEKQGQQEQYYTSLSFLQTEYEYRSYKALLCWQQHWLKEVQRSPSQIEASAPDATDWTAPDSCKTMERDELLFPLICLLLTEWVTPASESDSSPDEPHRLRFTGSTSTKTLKASLSKLWGWGWVFVKIFLLNFNTV